MKTPPFAALAAALFALSFEASASCGSAFCTLMTDRYAQGSGEPHIGWSAELRLESVNQSQLRSGTRNIAPDEVSGEEAIERRTRNLNLITTLGYGIDADWSIALRVPLVHRDHLHDLLDAETAAIGPSERWTFTRPGDVQLLARRQFSSADSATSWAWSGGLKLPTGAIDLVNGDGSRAERALQPGSGSTDLVLGVALRRALAMADALVVQASVGAALNTREDFKPGRRVELSAGWSHAFSHEWGAVLQLNARQRERDSGAQAEPDNSGSTMVDLSPGLTVAVGPASTLYAYIQQPLYQKVNGIQLVPRRSFAVGWTTDF